MTQSRTLLHNTITSFHLLVVMVDPAAQILDLASQVAIAVPGGAPFVPILGSVKIILQRAQVRLLISNWVFTLIQNSRSVCFSNYRMMKRSYEKWRSMPQSIL